MSGAKNVKLNMLNVSAMASVCRNASVMPENNCGFSFMDTSFEVSFFNIFRFFYFCYYYFYYMINSSTAKIKADKVYSV